MEPEILLAEPFQVRGKDQQVVDFVAHDVMQRRAPRDSHCVDLADVMEQVSQLRDSYRRGVVGQRSLDHRGDQIEVLHAVLYQCCTNPPLPEW